MNLDQSFARDLEFGFKRWKETKDQFKKLLGDSQTQADYKALGLEVALGDAGSAIRASFADVVLNLKLVHRAEKPAIVVCTVSHPIRPNEAILVHKFSLSHKGETDFVYDGCVASIQEEGRQILFGLVDKGFRLAGTVASDFV